MATAVSKDEADAEGSEHIERTGLSRVLPFRRDNSAEDDSRESPLGGRVFSAFVNRLPGRRESASDPFLDRQTAAATPSSATPASRTPTAGVARTRTPTQPVAARSTTPAAQQQRSDEELWQMFNADVAGTANVRATPKTPGTTSAPVPVAAVSKRPPVSNDSLPPWAQQQPVQPQPKSQTRDLPTLVAQAKVPHSSQERPARARVNPSAKPHAVPEAPPITRREADLRLEQLLAEARRHQEQGDLFEAYRVAVIAEELAEREHIVFAPRQERPVDIVHDIERQMQSALSATKDEPAVAAADTVQQLPPSGPVAVAIAHAAAPATEDVRPTADPFADYAWQSQQSEVEIAAARQPTGARNTAGRFDSEFPALHEWREVRANSPVSLAVSNTPTKAIDDVPDHPVRQALATGDPATISNREPLLARAEADRNRMLAAGQGTSLFSGDLRSPALATATRPNLQPVAVPAPPPLEAAPRKPAIAAATAGPGRSSRSGLLWWLLGGLAALSAAVAVRYRQQPGRRH